MEVQNGRGSWPKGSHRDFLPRSATPQKRAQTQASGKVPQQDVCDAERLRTKQCYCRRAGGDGGAGREREPVA
jgi:hypothetical protein